MIWSVIGDAISRLARSLHCVLSIPLLTTLSAPFHLPMWETPELLFRRQPGSSSETVDKSFIGPSLEILGFLISMPHAAIFHVALDKTFYSFFRVELSLPLPIDVRQCLASLASFLCTWNPWHALFRRYPSSYGRVVW